MIFKFSKTYPKLLDVETLHKEVQNSFYKIHLTNLFEDCSDISFGGKVKQIEEKSCLSNYMNNCATNLVQMKITHQLLKYNCKTFETLDK